MRKTIASLSAALVAAAALGTAGLTAASASGLATRAAKGVQTATRGLRSPAAPGAQLWVKRYNGPGKMFDSAYSVAVSPGGNRVFVTGESFGNGSREDYATIAYNPATGAQLWVQRYNGPGNNTDTARSVAVSPRGDRVFVTGSSYGSGSSFDYATVAYNAATGAQLWVKRYNGPANGIDGATAVRVSPNGGTVFVTGASTGPNDYDYATIAYNAATGARLWVTRYDGPGQGLDSGQALAVTNKTVFVTGQSTGTRTREDYATIAYGAATGAQLWAQRYNGPSNSIDGADAIQISPGGDVVFVTGLSPGADPDANDYATIAYDGAGGAPLWVKRYDGPANGDDFASSLAISPAGDKVYVTGSSTGTTTSNDYLTVAYDAATGARLWVKRYNGPASNIDVASSVAVSSTGNRVYVTGFSYGASSQEDYATVAYNAATGTQLWAKRYNGPGNWSDRANAVAASPSGPTVFVTGISGGPTRGYDYATVAYSG